MLNELIIVKVTKFSGTSSVDKNGLEPVMLQCIAGIMPNRNVLSGTVAANSGFEVGKTYLVNVRENGQDDEFGPDYTFLPLNEIVSALDLVRTTREVGPAKVLNIARPVGFEAVYIRKSTSVVSAREQRIKDGKYHSYSGAERDAVKIGEEPAKIEGEAAKEQHADEAFVAADGKSQ